MIITYDGVNTPPTYGRSPDGGAPNAAQSLANVVNAINTAISNRIKAVGEVANVQVLDVFGDLSGAQLLNRGEPEQLLFTQLNYFFRASRDVSGLCPLQGIEGLAEGGRRRSLGVTSASLQRTPLSFGAFASIIEIGTFYSVARQGASHKKYGTRIVGFYFKGIRANEGGGEVLYTYLPDNCGRMQPIQQLINPTIQDIEGQLAEVNRGSDYQVGIFKTPLSLRLRYQNNTWRNIINIGATSFSGKSSKYLNSFGMVTSLTPEGQYLAADTTSNVTFALDFERVTRDGDGPFGSYEMQFQSTNTNRSLVVDQQGKERTWSIPSVSAMDMSIGSPFSQKNFSTRTREKETTGQQQIDEKLTQELPATYYKLVNLTGTEVGSVDAAIWVTDNTQNQNKTKITVPLGKKLLFVATDNEVVQEILNAI